MVHSLRNPLDDTIAAVATPPGPSARGLIRVSGSEAWRVALGGFTPARPEPSPTRPTLVEGRLAVPGLRPPLPASIALWPAPRTYTGQELAEVHTFGSVPLLERVLADFYARGARPAEPGEFTLRAFLCGRIDLTQAEAVLGVIDASNASGLDAALRQLAGGLATPIGRLRDRLLDVLAHLEAGLDFVDEADVDPIGRNRLADELAAAADEMTALGERLVGRDRPEILPRVVLIGPPNAGKSHLFNALLASSHALVSPVAGTTRDYLAAVCPCDGLPVELVDTAGHDAVATAIEARAQAQRAEQITRADLLLVCHPAGATAVPDLPRGRPHRLVATKCDLAPPRAGSLPTSAATGAGLDALRVAIADALRTRPAEDSGLTHTGARCRDSLLGAGGALRNAAETLMLGGGDELVAVDLRQALEELGKVVGEVVTDDILDRIFRRFCIGK